MFRQTVWYSLSAAASRILAYFLYVYAGYQFGPETFGRFGNQSTYLMVFMIFSSFGLDLWLTRTTSGQVLGQADFWRVVSLRIGLTSALTLPIALLIGLKVFGVAIWGAIPEALVLLSSLYFDHIGLTAGAIFEGRKKLSTSANLSMIRFISLTVFGASLLYFHPTLMSLNLAFLLSSITRACIAWIWVRPQLSGPNQGFQWRQLMREAGPMALLNGMVALYFHIDNLMIPELSSLSQAGWYKSAYVMIEALLFLSAGISSALFPYFSKPHIPIEHKAMQANIGLKYMFLMAFPIVFGGNVMAETLVQWFYGAQAESFSETATALGLLLWALPFMFANNTLVRFFLGLHWHRAVLVRVVWIAFLNIAINAYAIPIWGYRGAAIATIISEGSLFFCCPGV